MPELKDRLDLAVRIALEAGAGTLAHFQRDGLAVDRKADNSPVTRADREAEELMRRRLGSACPDDGVVGEEYGASPGRSPFTWYLDPIDGTQSFIRGVPLFGTMMALARDGDPVAGVIVFPALGEIVYAARGHGAWWAAGARRARAVEDLNPRRARVSTVAQLADATVSTTGLARLFGRAGLSDQWLRLLAATGAGRGYPDCYGHYLVARGSIDVMVDPVMSVWDNAPLLPIVTEAGGRFTSVAGEATIDGGSAVSSNGLLHEAVLAILGAGPPG